MEWKLADKTFTIPPVGGYDSTEGGEMFLPIPNPLPGGNTHMISGAVPGPAGRSRSGPRSAVLTALSWMVYRLP